MMKKYGRHDTQDNNTQHNDIQTNDMSIFYYVSWLYAYCCYAEFCYAGSRSFLLGVIRLNVVAPNMKYDVCGYCVHYNKTFLRHNKLDRYNLTNFFVLLSVTK